MSVVFSETHQKLDGSVGDERNGKADRYTMEPVVEKSIAELKGWV